MGRSNMFKRHENMFKKATKEELVDLALMSAQTIIDEFIHEESGNDLIFVTLIHGIKLGVNGDGIINSDEKMLIDKVFENVWKSEMSKLYKIIEDDKVTDEDFDFVETISQYGNDIAIPFLHFVLSFAYIDGKFEEEVAERLDTLFGLNFLSEMFNSDLEEIVVEDDEIQLFGLEAEIIKWFDSKNSDDNIAFINEDDIYNHFCVESRSDIKNTLDSLCEKLFLSYSPILKSYVRIY